MRKYGAIFLMAWQDSLVYRLNALVWVLYAVVPAITLMLVWIAAYRSNHVDTIGGLTLPGMMTYYVAVTTLAIIITPHPEWEIAQQIRDGLITQFIVRPLSYYTYRLAQESAYQIVKSVMLLPALGIMLYLFRNYLHFPSLNAPRLGCFVLAALLAYIMLSQLKFLLGISAFWVTETGGFLEIWNILMGVFAGRFLPLALLPSWLIAIGNALPFPWLYAFPLRILLGNPSADELMVGFSSQLLWILVLGALVRIGWQRGLRAYEAYGG